MSAIRPTVVYLQRCHKVKLMMAANKRMVLHRKIVHGVLVSSVTSYLLCTCEPIKEVEHMEEIRVKSVAFDS